MLRGVNGAGVIGCYRGLLYLFTSLLLKVCVDGFGAYLLYKEAFVGGI